MCAEPRAKHFKRKSHTPGVLGRSPPEAADISTPTTRGADDDEMSVYSCVVLSTVSAAAIASF